MPRLLSHNGNEAAPSYSWIAVIASDSTVYTDGTRLRALYVGAAGNLVLEGHDGNIETFSNVPAGTTLDVGPRRVMAATTANLMVGLK